MAHQTRLRRAKRRRAGKNQRQNPTPDTWNPKPRKKHGAGLKPESFFDHRSEAEVNQQQVTSNQKQATSTQHQAFQSTKSVILDVVDRRTRLKPGTRNQEPNRIDVTGRRGDSETWR